MYDTQAFSNRLVHITLGGLLELGASVILEVKLWRKHTGLCLLATRRNFLTVKLHAEVLKDRIRLQ